MSLERVITGGQTGAEQAGWRAATACGFPTGGWMPMGYRTEGRLLDDGTTGPDESHPEFAAMFSARAHESLEYRLRTRANIEEADALAWFGDPLSREGRISIPLAGIVGIAACVVELGDDGRPMQSPRWLADWLRDEAVETLLVSGNRESKAPGIGVWVEAFLAEVFPLLRQM